MTTAAVAPGATAPARAGRLPIATVLTGAFVVTLLRPLSWALGLAGFLAGGGLLLLAWPVVVLPTPTGIQNALGGPMSTLIIGTPSPAMLTLIGVGAAAGLALGLGGLVAGAWAERNLIGVGLEAADDEAMLAAPKLEGAPGTWKVALLRLFALLPPIAAAILVWQPLYAAAYHELVLPDDLVTPLAVRVIRDVPWHVIAPIMVWVAADTAGALGVRRLVIERRPVIIAWLLGWVDIVRSPIRVLVTAVFGLAIVALLTGPAMVAAGAGWARVRDVMTHESEPVAAFVTVSVWVAIWLGGLVLAGVGAAIRANAWTLETASVRPVGVIGRRDDEIAA